MNKKVLFITQAAVIAALYIVLTMLSGAMGLASGVIQVRLSEALTILPYFTPAAIPGLVIGCFFGNFFSGSMPMDMVVGSLATLLGAFGSYGLRKYKWLVAIPPILANALIVPWVLIKVYEVKDAYFFLVATVGIGEVIACGVLGTVFLLALDKNKGYIFPKTNAS